MSILSPLYNAVAWLIVHIHSVLSHVLAANGGASWALSIVLLTIFMRVLMIPLVVKQIKSQRAMMAIQPQMKALQAKYKDDKEKLNQEMTKLWRESGANPFMGCLPLLPQFPIFIALFHTLNKLKPTVKNGVATFVGFGAFTTALVTHAANAKIFGVPFAASFNDSSSTLHALGASASSTRILCAVLTLIMVATTFLSQRQMMARSASMTDGPMPQQQKVMLYVLPLFFLLYGYRFPIGVLIYWLTTNLWAIGQQRIVLRRMDAQSAAPAGNGVALPAGPAPGAKPIVKPNLTKPTVQPTPKPLSADGPSTGNGASPTSRPNNGRNRPPQNSRPRKKKRR